MSSHPWRKTVALLGIISTAPEETKLHASVELIDRYRAWQQASFDAVGARRVKIVERPNTLTALIDWSDAQGGRYAQQRWRFGIAKVQGICAICGEPIYPGQPMYKPICTPLPANAAAMIAAHVVNCLPITDI